MSSRAKIARPPSHEAGEHERGASPEAPLVLDPVSSQSGIAPVVLLGKKLPIGSDPGSAIRLTVAGVEPRHATIERKRTGVVIRAHSRDVTLNHIPVDQAALHEGDRLAIGPVEFAIRRANADELARAIPEPETPLATNGAAETAPQTATAPQAPAAPVDGARQSEIDLQAEAGRLARRKDRLTALRREQKQRAAEWRRQSKDESCERESRLNELTGQEAALAARERKLQSQIDANAENQKTLARNEEEAHRRQALLERAEQTLRQSHNEIENGRAILDSEKAALVKE